MADAASTRPDAGSTGRDAGTAVRDAGTSARDAGASAGDAGTRDSGTNAGSPFSEVDVSHPRELRGAWVATVANINFPSRSNLSADAQRAELVTIVQRLAEVGANAIFFQVRPESDALYRSALEPWSRSLTGTQGRDPGYDPLAVLVEEAHARSLEVHAWLNPYRAKSNASSTAVAPHVSLAQSRYAYRYGNTLWMDPAAASVRAHVVAVVRDIVRRYDVDGVHFDDYFYPYPDGTPFPDDATYSEYRAGGGTMSRGDWRRDNVNQLVRQVGEAVALDAPWVRFGISPFGIYRPGIPSGIVGLDQYAEIYADPPTWMSEGWVDYLAPQLYWPSTQTRQAYGPLIQWWASLTAEGRHVFAGNYLSQLGSSAAWTVAELRTQIDLTRAQQANDVLGNIFYHVGPILRDQLGVNAMFRQVYAVPAMTPPVPRMPMVAVALPRLTLNGPSVGLDHPARASLRGFVVYREASAGAWRVDRIVPRDATSVRLTAGRFAISAVSKYGRESRGLAFSIR